MEPTVASSLLPQEQEQKIIYVFGEETFCVSEAIDLFKKKLIDERCAKFVPVGKNKAYDQMHFDKNSKFLFVKYHSTRLSIYDKNQKGDSYYTEINFVRKEPEKDVIDVKEEGLVIIVFNWRNETPKDFIHEKSIEMLWQCGVQLELQKFSKVLLTVKEDFNEKQLQLCELAFGIKFKRETSFLRECWRKCVQLALSVKNYLSECYTKSLGYFRNGKEKFSSWLSQKNSGDQYQRFTNSDSESDF